MPGGAPSRLEAVEVTVQSARFSSLEKEDALKHKVAAIRKHLKAQKLQQRQRRGHASFWLSAEQEREHVAEKCGERSWQHTLVGVIQSQRAQVIIITLLVLDVLIICAELFIMRNGHRAESVSAMASPAAHRPSVTTASSPAAVAAIILTIASALRRC